MTENKFLPIGNMALLSEEYLTKRISLLLINGDIITGTAGWYVEHDFIEETGVEFDFGFELNNAFLNGQQLGHSVCIPESQIKGYFPLESPNTKEEIDNLLGSS